MAELGETQDPAALIPGKPEAIEENARVLQARAGEAGNAADGLKAIDTGAWQGPAASAFHDKFSYEPGKWYAAADSLQAASGALNDHASTLRWAQAQAAEAISLWNQGQATTQQAKASHDHAAAQAAANNQPPPPFTDPGESQRQAAREKLNRARAQLTDSGNITAQTLRDRAGQAPQKSSWLDDVGDTLAQAGADVVNAMASAGNAMLNHPLDTLTAVGGIGLTVISSAGEGVGGLLDATGVGAIAGVPLNIVSAAGIAAGASMTGAAAIDSAGHGARDDHVEPIKANSSNESAGSSTADSSPPAGAQDGWSSRASSNGKGTVWLCTGVAARGCAGDGQRAIRFGSSSSCTCRRPARNTCGPTAQRRAEAPHVGHALARAEKWFNGPAYLRAGC
ncbi:hypothetical protein QRX50_35150 [Amycolatopsis carbonis]|uniref:Putative T7SS secretion signal domain-containing protein n=1 Tax=Amycolatopsis carbonis TaxID=715471 RepID=A0A9Y2MV95_9PSEU|nr:hypothetical protein [Amycolatopsis sp. 2-15]WIX76659.1 hypothetical protein QRX50_35150 [Amycolatopsis sp. 2-15]